VSVRAACVVLAALAATGAARRAGADQVTVVIVRHAETDPASEDPQRPLSERGQRRALELARVLSEVRPAAIYATQYARTQLTAEAVARVSGTAVTTVAAADAAMTVKAVSRARWGTTVVVVGHSNTVPLIVEGLTKEKVEEAVTHDRLYIVTLTRRGRPKTLRLRYGERDEAPAH
jgi:phosphohistidine phosphatase SixA